MKTIDGLGHDHKVKTVHNVYRHVMSKLARPTLHTNKVIITIADIWEFEERFIHSEP